MNPYSHSDLTNGGVVTRQEFYPEYMDEQYRHVCYKQLQANFGVDLFEAIQHCRHPVIVEIFEDQKTIPDISYDRKVIITLSARLTPVERHHCVVNVLDDYDNSTVMWSNERHSITYQKLHKSLNRFLGFFGVK